jgi:hypothetical protein
MNWLDRRTFKFIGTNAQASLLWYVDFQKQLALWKSGSFGLPTDMFLMRSDKTAAGIPWVLQFLISYLVREDLYRNAMYMCTHGDPYTIQAIRVTIERNALDKVSLSEFDPGAIVGLVKYWYMALPRGLLAPEIFEQPACFDGESVLADVVRDHINAVPMANRALLVQLIWLLQESGML